MAYPSNTYVRCISVYIDFNFHAWVPYILWQSVMVSITTIYGYITLRNIKHNFKFVFLFLLISVWWINIALWKFNEQRNYISDYIAEQSRKEILFLKYFSFLPQFTLRLGQIPIIYMAYYESVGYLSESLGKMMVWCGRKEEVSMIYKGSQVILISTTIAPHYYSPFLESLFWRLNRYTH